MLRLYSGSPLTENDVLNNHVAKLLDDGTGTDTLGDGIINGTQIAVPAVSVPSGSPAGWDFTVNATQSRSSINGFSNSITGSAFITSPGGDGTMTVAFYEEFDATKATRTSIVGTRIFNSMFTPGNVVMQAWIGTDMDTNWLNDTQVASTDPDFGSVFSLPLSKYSLTVVAIVTHQTGGMTLISTAGIGSESIPIPNPEPATVALLGIGVAGLFGVEYRRRRKNKAGNGK
jgi:hypothetical protein